VHANGKVGGPLTQLMRKKIDDGGFETPYRLRKQVVEPVFGQIKQAPANYRIARDSSTLVLAISRKLSQSRIGPQSARPAIVPR
jgi:hypothetical protein